MVPVAAEVSLRVMFVVVVQLFVVRATAAVCPHGALHLRRRRVQRERDQCFFVLGVREGLLYSLLKAREQKRDPLIAAAADLNVLRSRSPSVRTSATRRSRRGRSRITIATSLPASIADDRAGGEE